MNFIVYLTVIALGLSRWALPINDPDLGWQLLGGQWILEHHSLPSYDFINALNSNWHDYHWLAQIVLYKLYSIGGFELLKFAYGLFMAAFFCLVTNVFHKALGLKPSLIVWALCSILACFLLAYISSIRPQMLALFGVALSLRILQNRASISQLLALFLITALLANLHVYWLLIPALWLALRIIPGLLRPKNSWHLLGQVY